MTKTFPTSRFAPLELARPLETFGQSFSVEISSSLTLSPNTVLRATTGLTLQTIVRRYGFDTLLKKLRYGATGNHALSRTSQRLIADMFSLDCGGFDSLNFDAVSIDAKRKESMAFVTQVGNALDKRLNRPSVDSGEWELIAAGLGPFVDSNPIHVLVREWARFDALSSEVTALAGLGKTEEAEAKVRHILKGVIGAWEALVPGLPRHRCVLLDSTLRTLCQLEHTFTASSGAQGPSATAILALLDPGKKPLGHWFEELRRAVKCRDNMALEKYLSRTVVIRGRPISYDRLKAWASVQPENVMLFDAMKAIVAAVPDARKRDHLQSRFLLARGLTFLADFLRSSAGSSDLTWQDSQDALAQRYSQLFCEG